MVDDEIQERMLEELTKIRAAVEEKPSPPPPPPEGFFGEFIRFLNKHDIMGLALAVVIGGAVSKLVSALVVSILMPSITFFIPEGEWQTYALTIGRVELSLGHFAGAVLDFLIIFLLVFLFMRQLDKLKK
ncbi:MAG: MscL family protein [Candidatus Bathyarchaeota archaeon]|jgi:large conductance mechanosensitive channel